MNVCQWPDCGTAVKRKWCLEHANSAALVRISAWQKDHSEQTTATKKASRAKRRDVENKKHREKKRTPSGREQVAKDNHLRRVRAVGGESVPFRNADMIKLYGTTCYLCDEEIDLDAPRKCGAHGWQLSFWREHVIPLVAGGPDTIENCRPSHAICNLRKGTK